VTLLLYVEGQTEEEALPGFFQRWLADNGQNVRIKPVNFKGAGRYLHDFAKRAKLDLTSGSASGIIGLLDLYGSSLSYPQKAVAEKYRWAKAKLEAEVGDTRFRQHFTVHETEAWLLSGKDVFPQQINVRLPKTPPEGINFQNPPSKRLERLYPSHVNRKYAKVRDGVDLFDKLDPNAAYARCPHLKLLLDDILALAT
jgi:Domain of unknown function (DUF4276)